ncbi:protein At-4/1-like [Sitophilus oryzae]|uniref:Protein At-4/1-like n=1 Tax=Sitophilus oryzae TaxID=7048 RepID=A0A6J2YXN2_SITOR|nr:protein At-4/1-like [Sitophilus oryzae]
MEDFQKGYNENISSNKTSLVEFEISFRKLKNELFLKRNEASKLKTELIEVNEEKHKLKISLDKLKKNFDENKITLDLVMKKMQEFEPRYYEKRDALIKSELQYKIAVTEIDVLKQDLQKISSETSQLTRKLDNLEEKQKCDATYNGDMSAKFAQIKNQINTIKAELENATKDQYKITEISRKIDLSEEAVKKCKELKLKNKTLKEELEKSNEENVKLKAQWEKFEDIYQKSLLKEEFNLPAKIFLIQCKKMSSFYTEAIKNRNELLTTANKLLEEEKLTNKRLIEENEKLFEKCRTLDEKSEKLCLNQ